MLLDEAERARVRGGGGEDAGGSCLFVWGGGGWGGGSGVRAEGVVAGLGGVDVEGEEVVRLGLDGEDAWALGVSFAEGRRWVLDAFVRLAGVDGEARKDAEVSGPLGIIQNQKGQRTTRVEAPEGKGVVWKKLVLLAGWEKDGRSWYREHVVLYMFVWSACPPGCLPRALASPPGSAHRMFSRHPKLPPPLDLAPIPSPTVVVKVWSRGVTCAWGKRGPLHRRCNAKTKPSTEVHS